MGVSWGSSIYNPPRMSDLDPLKTASLAQRMRDARETRGAALADVEKDTRIRRRYLEAIETGDWAQLPDGPPSRGFVRIYARYLGMDADQCVMDFEVETGNIALVMRDEYIPPPPTRERPQSRRLQQARQDAQALSAQPPRWKAALPAPEAAELDALADGPPIGGAVLSPGERVYRSLDELEADPEPEPGAAPERMNGHTSREDMRSSFNLKRTPVITSIRPPQAQPRRGVRAAALPSRALGMIVAGVVVAIGLALIAFVGVPAVSRLLAAGVPTAAAAAARPTPVFESTPIFISTPASPTAAAPIAATAIPTAVLRFTPRPGGLQFTLDARERAWVRVTVDGATVFEGIAPIGPALAWKAARTVTIETGNAGAFDAIIQGERLGPLGARNTVVRKTYDTAGTVKDE